MRKYILFLGIGIFMVSGVVSGLLEKPTKIEAQVHLSPRDRKDRAAFQPIRTKLEEKRVPFDPEILLDRTGPEAVRRVAHQIPEMRQKRFLGEKVKGIQMADPLLLPERVELIGDTLLLAKRIIFEGNNVVIKGHHNIYFIPLESDGALGISLDSAIKATFGNQASRDLSERLQTFEPKLITSGYSLTIDASGLTYDEWLLKKAKKEFTGFAVVSEQDDTCPPNSGCSPVQSEYPPVGPTGSPVPDLTATPGPLDPSTPPFGCISSGRTRGADGGLLPSNFPWLGSLSNRQTTCVIQFHWLRKAGSTP
ncbi:MAG: hypothetical protein AB7J13_14065 [Pyrinomonadaceae bacterium]